MQTTIFETVGRVIIFLFAGMGIGIIVLWAIEKFIKYVLKHFGLYKVLIDFIFDYKKFKQFKNDTK